MLLGCSRHHRTNWISETTLSEEWRGAEVRRAFRPGAWPYLGFLVIIYCSTSYSSDHPLVFASFSIWVTVAAAARLAIVYSRRASLEIGSLWRQLVFGLLITSGLSWGLFLAVTLHLYNFESPSSLLLLVCTVGITTGAITAYSPGFRLLTCYLGALLVPSILVETYLDNPLGKPMAAMTILFLAFLIWQSRLLNRSYWQNVYGQKLLGERAHDLAEANEALRRENGNRLAAEKALLNTTEQLLRQQRELEVRVTERTTELERAKRAAEAANLAKGEFLAKMSHEIRTPMHGVLGMTHLALTADCSAELREYLEAIRISSDSLLQIINDILDLSKIEARKLTIDARPFRPADCIESCVKHLRLEAARKGLPISVEIDPLLPEMVLGDSLRLRQVLTNLIHNAIKFTASGEIDVTATRETARGAPQLHIAVRDTGCGIALEKRESIFEAFTQADGSTTRQFGGTGLGLTISGELVRLMKGRIWLESEVEEGSIFHIVLPLVEQPEANETCSKQAHA